MGRPCIQLAWVGLVLLVDAEEQASVEYFASVSDPVVALGGEPIDPAPGWDRPTAMARWEAFLDAHPDSPYAAFVRWNLSANYGVDPEQTGAASDRAVELLESLIDNGPRFLADDALRGLVRSRLAAGETDAAREAASRLVSDFADSEHVADARRLLDGSDR